MDTHYLNPVYDRSFPDPFVLKYCGVYWAYCTGLWHDGRCFGILRSRDLVHWQEVGSAMEPLPRDWPHYWAPEVTYHNGHFYLYYSVGDEEYMELRVAVASSPGGPFVDSGHRLTSEQFAIDGHVFVDDDGTRYLFYATDFLDHSYIGTGTVRDQLLDPYTLASRPQPVTRPRYDWQIYDPERKGKGGLRWHTVEGPFVLKRKDRYYEMFSGGNWQNLTYGVSYAISDSLAGSGEWQQVADGRKVLPILRTIAGQVIGPGHNSVVRGPDNQQLFCVYHRWRRDINARVMAIDPLDWAGPRMLVLGPSTTLQPMPLPAALADFFDPDRADGLDGWECGAGHWSAHNGEALQLASEGVSLVYRPLTHPRSALVEVSLRALDDVTGAYGLALGGVATVLVAPARGELIIRRQIAGRWLQQGVPLPTDFDARAYHLLRVEINDRRLNAALDERAVRWQGELPESGDTGAIALLTEKATAAFAGFALTIGWQDLFEQPVDTPKALGWQAEGSASWILHDMQLLCDAGDSEASVFKGPLLDNYELVVNACLTAQAAPDGCYGMLPAARPGQPGPLLTVERAGERWMLRCTSEIGIRLFGLPENLDPSTYQQFRLRRQGHRLSIQWEALTLGEIVIPSEPAGVGLYVRHATAAFDMVRVTALGPIPGG